MRERAVSSGLYIHVPFCARKCEYCAFYSTSADGLLVQRYVDGLIRELETRKFRACGPLKTVFFGGGTPSILSLAQWERILSAMSELDFAPGVEWTVECNPATLSMDKARLLRSGGVNRISMGVQSFDEGLLDRLGRVHDRDMVYRSYEILRKSGFVRVNLDLMFGIPGQSMEIWDRTLNEAVALASEHLSCYEVIYEEDTPLFEQMKAREFDVDEELNDAMFERLVERAEAAGFRQYEVANFAMDLGGSGDDSPGRQPGIPSEACRHNINYWRGGGYEALGPSASGYEDGRRYRNIANTSRYCERVERGEATRDWEECLAPVARAGELAAFGLRMNAGWPWHDFAAVTGFDLRDGWSAEMDRLVGRGWGERDAEGFRLTRRGLRFADAAGSEFLRTGTESESESESERKPIAADQFRKRMVNG